MESTKSFDGILDKLSCFFSKRGTFEDSEKNSLKIERHVFLKKNTLALSVFSLIRRFQQTNYKRSVGKFLVKIQSDITLEQKYRTWKVLQISLAHKGEKTHWKKYESWCYFISWVFSWNKSK